MGGYYHMLAMDEHKLDETSTMGHMGTWKPVVRST
jgi:hypothetical protein